MAKAGTLTFRIEIKKFLNKFCIKDSKDISNTTHKLLMENHFYYVDHRDQGWYVLTDANNFFEDLEESEWEVYGELWQDATAYA